MAAVVLNANLFLGLVVYDRELSISERSVKWYDIVNNNSHIQGKYTVHILPEGYVFMEKKKATIFQIYHTHKFTVLHN